MDWGALLVTENGAPFITPQSIPLAMYSRKQAAVFAGGATTISETFPAGRPVIPFAYTTVSCAASYTVSGNTCNVTFKNAAGNGTVYVYFFTIFAQALPSWGIAIWDEQGTCILTNETRVLTDVQSIGTNGSDSAGFSINTTLAGKYGIVPATSGLATGVILDGGTRPWSSQYFFSAVFNGGTTQIGQATTGGTAGSGVSNLVYHNMKNSVYALNLANYD
ncbi:hypothetical protein [Pseudescherichia vulneris]|uniref:hypothetical protein n=1 Tax=Pseudescherichia vulneris TaxID=566 RepID=UPI001EDE3191|nr:hypothetical protein [Pseudescherichia vulneris]